MSDIKMLALNNNLFRPATPQDDLDSVVNQILGFV